MSGQYPVGAHQHYGQWHAHAGGDQHHEHPLDQPPVINPGAAATNGFMQGFAGCLGVGMAIVVVIVVFLVLASVGSHH